MANSRAPLPRISPLAALQQAIADGSRSPAAISCETLARANGNASRNTYLWLDQAWLEAQAVELEERFDTASRPPLYGVPISLKDCFDLAGTPTSGGTHFYAERNGVIATDSAVAACLKQSGALITGKTHLHALAYGITGENRDFGDCLQPRDSTLLTGGSSSGAVASVQEGSALIAIGTDTGGSIRVPAALCGLVGYRASHAFAYDHALWPEPEGLWAGGIHLAQSFDTVGVFTRDPRDIAPAMQGIFGLLPGPSESVKRIGCISGDFLSDCDPEVLSAMNLWRSHFESIGITVEDFTQDFWADSHEIFAGIQAHEAAAIHRGHFDAFEPAITQRLQWGATIIDAEVSALRERMAAFRTRLLDLFQRFDLIMLPCAPVRRLVAGEDHSAARPHILKYTTPFSLAGLPALALPGELLGGALGTGVQIGASPGSDPALLAFAGNIGQSLVEAQP